MKLAIAAITDVGRVRPANEDAFVIDADARLLAVADGMGGHQAGEVASAAALGALQAQLAGGQPLDAAITEANHVVFTRAGSDVGLRGMGTTLTAAVYGEDAVLTIGHVGDSRAYLLRDGEFRQLTVDHSVVAELVAAGQLTEDEAVTDPRRSMITRALGIDSDIEVDLVPVELATGDRLLFCSDGLTTMLRDDVIADLLRREPEREQAAQSLVAGANDAGGADNITVLIADVVDDDVEIPGAPAPAAPPESAGAADELDDTPTLDVPDDVVASATEPTDQTETDQTDQTDRTDQTDQTELAGEASRRRWWQRRRRQ